MHGLLLMKTFDGLDNRKVIMDCFVRMGRNLPEDCAAARRAGFLQGLSDLTGGVFNGNRIIIEGKPTAEEAYALFLQITAHLGKPILEATMLLEKAVKCMEKSDYASLLKRGWQSD